MANSEDESNGVEVDNSYHSVVTSWFNNDELKKNETSNDGPSAKGVLKLKSERKRKIKEEKRKSLEENKPSPSKRLFPVNDLKQISPNLSTFLNEKLTKKLKKSKWKTENKVKDGQSMGQEDMDSDVEEDSKTSVITKMAKSVDKDVPTPLSVGAVKKRLETATLSPSARKRLKKRLNKMLTETGQEKRDADTSLGSVSPEKTQVTTKNTSKPSPDKKMADSAAQKWQIASDDGNEAPDMEEEVPRKRKKTKKRSKQKNIRKDNRPEHLKPPHLRKKQSDDDSSSDSDSGSEKEEMSPSKKNEKQKSFTNILSSSKTLKKSMDSPKKKNKSEQKEGAATKINPLVKKVDSPIRLEPHTIESLQERLQEEQLSRSTRKRLNRVLNKLMNPGQHGSNKGDQPTAKKDGATSDSGDKKAKKRKLEENSEEDGTGEKVLEVECHPAYTLH